MRRPVWHRALIALWGVWFTAVLIGPPGLHACPQHAAAHEGMAGHMAHAGHAGGGGAHASMAAHAGMAPDQAPAAPEHGSTECNCLGCCSATAHALPSVAAELEPPAAVAVAAAEFAPQHALVLRAAHAHPFANGPPAVVV